MYGNRAVRVGSYIPTPALTPTSAHSTDLSAFNSTNNRIALSGYDYDQVGNLEGDPTTGANAIVYDAENRMISYTRSGVTTTYAYDGDGRRVSKTDASGTLVFVYNAAGQLIAEYTTGTVTGTLTTSYLTTDHLGSTRVVTDPTGAATMRSDYLPFGEKVGSNIGGRSGVSGYTGQDSTRQKFTGYERDDESNLDYAKARYHSSAQGRFTSCDPYNIVIEMQRIPDSEKAQNQFLAYLSYPQRWNRYAYTINNPMLYTDPDGRDITIYFRPRDPNQHKVVDQGHFFIYVRNDETGESAYWDYPGFELSSVNVQVTQGRLDAHSSITIETTADQEQAILNGIRELMQNIPEYNARIWSLLLGTESTCVNTSESCLAKGGINIYGTSPIAAWQDAYEKYSNATIVWREQNQNNPRYLNTGVITGILSFDGFSNAQPGREYGRDPRGQARTLDRNALNAYKGEETKQ